MFSVEVVAVAVVALVIGAGLYYLIFGRKSDDALGTGPGNPMYLAPKKPWDDGKELVLTIDYVHNHSLLLAKKSSIVGGDPSQRWIVDLQSVNGVDAQVVYNDEGPDRNYLSNAGNGSLVVRTVPATAPIPVEAAWSVFGVVTSNDEIVSISNIVDPVLPQILALKFDSATGVLNLEPYSPGMTGYVWKSVVYP